MYELNFIETIGMSISLTGITFTGIWIGGLAWKQICKLQRKQGKNMSPKSIKMVEMGGRIVPSGNIGMNTLFSVDGERHRVCELAERFGIHPNTYCSRVNESGMSPLDALAYREVA
ncbi:MAG: hypothetical protein C4522_10640 [Desulfobacteraceae bacterium]|nr:MAG: hypothetical protein C4522_10640 [Desulfobacteraceae bacterium]